MHVRSFLSVFLWSGALLFARASGDAPALPPETVIAELQAGNSRFVAGQAQRPHQSVERRRELVAGQAPRAIVLTCADSRVSPEIYLDQGLGDLFVLRNAGDVLNDHMLGSIEYAVEHLHVTTVVVIGHTRCGAVSAAVAGGHAPGHIASVVDAIAPAVETAKRAGGDLFDQSIRAHAQRVAELLRASEPILAPRVKAQRVRVYAARYDLATGQVEFLPQP